MQVIKRDGNSETISFDKITKRLCDLSFGLTHVDPLLIAKETINGIFNGIKTTELDILSAEICATKTHHHPEYNKLGGRIIVSNIIKTTSSSYIEVIQPLYENQIISKEFYDFVVMYEKEIQEMFDYERDYLFDFFAMKTLERSYLFKINGKIVERPQHMWMRVAIQIHSFVHQDSLSLIKETYDLMSLLYFTHATPTLFNAGTNHPQLSSCFLLSTEDNIEDIFKSISDVAQISKWAGGIGLSLSNIRAKGSMIRGTNGKSEGIIPLCKTLEMVGRYINQGGKRNGSICAFIEPWHADIYSFIELRKNTGDENLRARDLFIALWVPDLFMKRVQEDADWTLMCPDECKGLVDNYGEKFEELYISYEQQQKGKRVVKAKDLWNHILENQIETGIPYISFKDSVNRKNMQKQLGTIRNSNLCVSPETMILTSTGYFPIKSLENQQIEIWNGEEFTPTTVYKTGHHQELMTVKFSNGHSLSCTLYHKFYIQKEKITEFQAKDLLTNMKIIPFSYPIIRDGFNIINESPLYVPINGSLQTKLSWLQKLFDKYGKVISDGYSLYCNPHILEHTSYLLHTLGCFTTIKEKEIILHYSSLKQLVSLGLEIDIENVIHIEPDEIYITEIIYKQHYSDTYCFKEEKRGMGIFNGVLTGQCNEIALYSNKDEISVCNLCSICLPRFVKNKSFDFEELERVAGIACRNLNNVIDVNFYPVPETKRTNVSNRPIGIGIQGLADIFLMLGLSFGSDEARSLNKRIFETIYYGSVKMSISLAKLHGPYTSIENSPHSEGLLQFDLWPNVETFYDWTEVKKDLKKYGIRNSLLTALMPTASTSQIMGNNETMEPYTSNVYLRKTLAGEFTVVNHHLVSELTELGLWNDQVYNEILYDNGSVQKVKSIPEDIKHKYKTAYELKITDMLKQAVERSPFVDHMQSMNLFMAKPDFNLLNSSHFYSWKNGLKTGMYYLRTQPAVDAIKFGLDPTFVKKIKDERKTILKNAGVEDGSCPRDAYLKSICESCSS